MNQDNRMDTELRRAPVQGEIRVRGGGEESNGEIGKA